MTRTEELAERIKRLEAWADDFSRRAEHADVPVFSAETPKPSRGTDHG